MSRLSLGVGIVTTDENHFQYDEHPYTEFLDFTFSVFGKPIVDNAKGIIVLPVREFSVSSDFPGYDHELIVMNGDVIFKGVVSSIRVIREHEEFDNAKYKDSYTIDDGPFPDVEDKPYYFYIGGFTYDPSGWVEWDIDVVSIEVRAYETKLPTIT